MAKPGVMTKFRIDELSGVDNPAQKGARAAIMKRDDDTDSTQGDTMSNLIIKALGLPEDASEKEAADAIAKSISDLAVAKAEGALTDAQRAVYADLKKADPAKAKAFLDSTDEEKDETCKKAASGDETVTVEGRTISKRAVGDDMFAIMKAQSDRIAKTEADIAKARDAAETASFIKSASEDYPSLAGSVEERALVLKALAKSDEATRAAGEAILKAAEAASSFAFSKRGTSAIAAGTGLEKADDKNPAGKLDALAKAYQKDNAGVSFAKAYEAVAMAHPDLYEAATAH